MRAGVLAAIGGGVALLVATVPASAFDSGTDPDTYYQSTIAEVDNHRAQTGAEGLAFESVDGFTRRLPDDSFDDLILGMVNRYRSEHGLPEFEQLEELRTLSAMWANRMADAQNGYLADSWYRTDADVACRRVDDIFTVSSFTSGTPQDVFNNWMQDPAVVNGILTPGTTWTGIATVDDGSTLWTTMRVVRGDCPGYSPYVPRTLDDSLPDPTLRTISVPHSGPSANSALQFSVARSGTSQITVEVQTLIRGRWLLWQKLYTEPNTTPITVDPPAGTYRVVVPAQAGYHVVIGATLTVS